MRVYTLSDMRSKKKLRVYTASEAKGLKRQNPGASGTPAVASLHIGNMAFYCVMASDLYTLVKQRVPIYLRLFLDFVGDHIRRKGTLYSSS